MNHDQLIHTECLDFIRLAVFRGNPNAASIVAATIKEICASGQADREQIWAELTPDERERFRELLESERPELCR